MKSNIEAEISSADTEGNEACYEIINNMKQELEVKYNMLLETQSKYNSLLIKYAEAENKRRQI